LGHVQDIAKPLLVLEYCSNGDLLKFVRVNKSQFIEVRFLSDLLSQALKKGFRKKICPICQVKLQ
jgi:hypothetical protein